MRLSGYGSCLATRLLDKVKKSITKSSPDSGKKLRIDPFWGFYFLKSYFLNGWGGGTPWTDVPILRASDFTPHRTLNSSFFCNFWANSDEKQFQICFSLARFTERVLIQFLEGLSLTTALKGSPRILPAGYPSLRSPVIPGSGSKPQPNFPS